MVVKYTSVLHATPGRIQSSVRAEFANYVDDTGKARLDRSNAYFMPPDERAAFRARQKTPEGKLTEQPKTIVAPAAFRRGEIQLEGFLAAKALQRGMPAKAPSALRARSEWIGQLGALWRDELLMRGNRRYVLHNRTTKRITALKFVFSPPKADVAALNAGSVSAITVLRRCMAASWKEYEKLHGLRAGSVGYAWAVHLDSDVLHAHTVVFPLTREGGRLQLSNRQMDRSQAVRKDNLTEFRAQVAKTYAQERSAALDGGPRASLVEQLTRSVGARAVNGLLRGRAPDEVRTDVIAMAAKELALEQAVRIPSHDVPTVLSRWIQHAARRSAAKDAAPTPAHAPDKTRVADAEAAWWRTLWLGLEWRRRRREHPEAKWPEFEQIASAVSQGRETGPDERKLPQIVTRVAADVRTDFPLQPLRDDPSWAAIGRLRVNEWLSQSREIVVRSLVVDALAARRGRDPLLKLWFSAETLRYGKATHETIPVAAPAIDIDRPLKTRDISQDLGSFER